MQQVTVTFDDVFDIVNDQSRDRQPCTLFSFRARHVAEYGVAAPGRPQLANGMTVTALLGKPGNWQALEGWYNHDTGEIIYWSPGRSAFAIVWAISTILLLARVIGESPKTTMACMSVVLLILCHSLWKIRYLLKVRTLLRSAGQH